jgi:hypothetical protein
MAREGYQAQQGRYLLTTGRNIPGAGERSGGRRPTVLPKQDPGPRLPLADVPV